MAGTNKNIAPLAVALTEMEVKYWTMIRRQRMWTMIYAILLFGTLAISLLLGIFVIVRMTYGQHWNWSRMEYVGDNEIAEVVQ